VKIDEVYGLPGSMDAYTDASPSAGTYRYWIAALNASGTASSPAGPRTITI
jgi:hypothetical protein